MNMLCSCTPPSHSNSTLQYIAENVKSSFTQHRFPAGSSEVTSFDSLMHILKLFISLKRHKYIQFCFVCKHQSVASYILFHFFFLFTFLIDLLMHVALLICLQNILQYRQIIIYESAPIDRHISQLIGFAVIVSCIQIVTYICMCFSGVELVSKFYTFKLLQQYPRCAFKGCSVLV